MLQRALAGNSGTPTIPDLVPSGSTLYAAATIAKTGVGTEAVACKLPIDGAGTGAYDFIGYSAASLTASTSTFSTATPSLTEAAGDGTEAAGGLTDAAGNVTVTRIS